MKTFIIVAHKFLTLPDDELVNFLVSRGDRVLHINHSFNDAPDRRTKASYYTGDQVEQYQTPDFKFLPEPLIYIKELIATWFIVARFKLTKIDYYIGLDGLCTLFGFPLKFLGFSKKVIYWAIDFVPRGRFNSKIIDAIYHAINTFGYKNADEMWDLSPRMKEARAEHLGLKDSDYNLLKVVPYGFWTDRVKKLTFEECDNSTLVFMGHIIEKQGLQLIIKTLPLLPDNISLKIIGIGPYKETAENLAKQLGVENRCNFLGKIDDIKELENEVANSAVALAPYIRSLDKWTYYADPGKVKTYLACGVPVLLTDLPWNTSEIVKRECGIVISEDVEDIARKINLLLEPTYNNKFRKNAIEYSKTFDYQNIFEKALE